MSHGRPWHRPSRARRAWLRAVDAAITVVFVVAGLAVGTVLGTLYATATL